MQKYTKRFGNRTSYVRRFKTLSSDDNTAKSDQKQAKDSDDENDKSKRERRNPSEDAAEVFRYELDQDKSDKDEGSDED